MHMSNHEHWRNDSPWLLYKLVLFGSSYFLIEFMSNHGEQFEEWANQSWLGLAELIRAGRANQRTESADLSALSARTCLLQVLIARTCLLQVLIARTCLPANHLLLQMLIAPTCKVGGKTVVGHVRTISKCDCDSSLKTFERWQVLRHTLKCKLGRGLTMDALHKFALVCL